MWEAQIVLDWWRRTRIQRKRYMLGSWNKTDFGQVEDGSVKSEETWKSSSSLHFMEDVEKESDAM